MNKKSFLISFLFLITGNIYGFNLNPPNWLIGTWHNYAESNTKNFVYIKFTENNIVFEYGLIKAKVENWKQIYKKFKVIENSIDNIYTVTLKKDNTEIVYEFKLQNLGDQIPVLTYSLKKNGKTLRRHSTSCNLVFNKESDLYGWTLRIVPTRFSAKQGTILDCATKGSCFYVVLTNVSKLDWSIWNEWCSWGYFCLSFKITLPDGKTIYIKKRPREWKKNYADPFIVRKGSHFVYSVRFDEAWEGFPKDWKNQKVKIKAIFEIKKEDDQAERHKVWLGKIESPEMEVNLFK